MNNLKIDSQELINQLSANYTQELANKDQLIANLQVTVKTLQRDLQQKNNEIDQFKQTSNDNKKGGK